MLTLETPAKDCAPRVELDQSKQHKPTSRMDSDEALAERGNIKPIFTLDPHHIHVERFDPKQEDWLYEEELRTALLNGRARCNYCVLMTLHAPHLLDVRKCECRTTG